MFTEAVGVQVKIKYDELETRGEVRVKHFSRQERLRRALKFLGILWGLAAVSVLFPLAHYVLVPGFFIAGIVVPLNIYSTHSVILGGQGLCPKCSAPLVIARSGHIWPLTDVCTQCQVNVVVEQMTAV